MEDLNFAYIIDKCLEGIISSSERDIRGSTITQYRTKLTKLLNFLSDQEQGWDIRVHEQSGIPMCFIGNKEDTKMVIADIHMFLADYKDRTKKSYWSVILSLIRNYDGDTNDFVEEFNKLKDTIDNIELQQQPKENELQLKGLTIKKLRKQLGKHPVGTEKRMMGELALALVFRNEPATLMVSNVYLDKDEYPTTNFLHNRGRNKKYIYIRKNKVRDCSSGDEEKKIEIDKELNFHINKYLVTHEFNFKDILSNKGWDPLYFYNKSKNGFIGEPVPFFGTRIDTPMSESNYCQILKTLWSHIGLCLTSTSIRKVYANDVRRLYNGKLTEELVACEKLDHNKQVHDTNYILYFE